MTQAEAWLGKPYLFTNEHKPKISDAVKSQFNKLPSIQFIVRMPETEYHIVGAYLMFESKADVREITTAFLESAVQMECMAINEAIPMLLTKVCIPEDPKTIMMVLQTMTDAYLAQNQDELRPASEIVEFAIVYLAMCLKRTEAAVGLHIVQGDIYSDVVPNFMTTMCQGVTVRPIVMDGVDLKYMPDMNYTTPVKIVTSGEKGDAMFVNGQFQVRRKVDPKKKKKKEDESPLFFADVNDMVVSMREEEKKKGASKRFLVLERENGALFTFNKKKQKPKCEIIQIKDGDDVIPGWVRNIKAVRGYRKLVGMIKSVTVPVPKNNQE